MDLRAPVTLALFPGHDGYDILQALDIDTRRFFAPEEIQEQRLGKRVCIRRRTLKGRSGKEHKRLQADRDLLGLELRQGPERVRVEVELQHVEHLVVEGPDQGQAVWPFLAVHAEHEQARVVLLREELQARRILERVDRVRLGEFLGERSFERVQLRDGALHEL